jgi:hypothetical protein
MLAERAKRKSKSMDTPYVRSWTGAHENFQAREYDAGASQASQRGFQRQREKRPTQNFEIASKLLLDLK